MEGSTADSEPRNGPALAVVLAAGDGTRMAPLTPERPKALLPTLDTPQLAWVLASVARAGAEQVFVNCHSGCDLIVAAAEEASRRLPVNVSFSPEPTARLGTAGALHALASKLTGPFLVANADIATDFPIERLIEAHRSAQAPATLLAIPAEDGADLIVEESWVIDLIDRREQVRSGHRYGGVAIFEPEVLELIPAGVSGLYETVMKGLVRAHRGLAAMEWDGYWVDVGSPRDHLKVNLDVLAGRRDPKVVSEAATEDCERWDVVAYVGQGAMVDDVELRHTVVGRGAQIAAGSRLERCVVWDGARLERGHYREAILTPAQVLKL
ncbi:MAG TPA: NDP-sugar synthase [Actinomycetota bacterium]|nr:NDP-sugar synthase [Actinomycetota bacterium]